MLRSVPSGKSRFGCGTVKAGAHGVPELPVIALRRDMDPAGLLDCPDDVSALHPTTIITNDPCVKYVQARFG
jgi:hypothetical protein